MLIEETASPAILARRLMREAERTTLATSLDGHPYASLVLVAADMDATPLLLLSDLAEHSRNLRRDPRAALLFDGTAGLAEPLTGPRVTVMGEVLGEVEPRQAGRYLARHPAAALYRGFRDFHFWRLSPARAHLVQGFGRIHWIEGRDLLLPAPELAASEADILAEMNADAATIDLYAQRLGLSSKGWQLSGIDPDGADLWREGVAARLGFDEPATTVAAVRAAFTALARRAGLADH